MRSLLILVGLTTPSVAMAAGDVEQNVPDWIRYGAPLGINREIDTNEVFPLVVAGREADRFIGCSGSPKPR